MNDSETTRVNGTSRRRKKETLLRRHFPKEHEAKIEAAPPELEATDTNPLRRTPNPRRLSKRREEIMHKMKRTTEEKEEEIIKGDELECMDIGIMASSSTLTSIESVPSAMRSLSRRRIVELKRSVSVPKSRNCEVVVKTVSSDEFVNNGAGSEAKMSSSSLKPCSSDTMTPARANLKQWPSRHTRLRSLSRSDLASNLQDEVEVAATPEAPRTAIVKNNFVQAELLGRGVKTSNPASIIRVNPFADATRNEKLQALTRSITHLNSTSSFSEKKAAMQEELKAMHEEPKRGRKINPIKAEMDLKGGQRALILLQMEARKARQEAKPNQHSVELNAPSNRTELEATSQGDPKRKKKCNPEKIIYPEKPLVASKRASVLFQVKTKRLASAPQNRSTEEKITTPTKEKEQIPIEEYQEKIIMLNWSEKRSKALQLVKSRSSSVDRSKDSGVSLSELSKDSPVTSDVEVENKSVESSVSTRELEQKTITWSEKRSKAKELVKKRVKTASTIHFKNAYDDILVKMPHEDVVTAEAATAIPPNDILPNTSTAIHLHVKDRTAALRADSPVNETLQTNPFVIPITEAVAYESDVEAVPKPVYATPDIAQVSHSFSTSDTDSVGSDGSDHSPNNEAGPSLCDPESFLKAEKSAAVNDVANTDMTEPSSKYEEKYSVVDPDSMPTADAISAGNHEVIGELSEQSIKYDETCLAFDPPSMPTSEENLADTNEAIVEVNKPSLVDEETCLVFDPESMPATEESRAGTYETTAEVYEPVEKYKEKCLVAEVEVAPTIDKSATENDEAIVGVNEHSSEYQETCLLANMESTPTTEENVNGINEVIVEVNDHSLNFEKSCLVFDPKSMPVAEQNMAGNSDAIVLVNEHLLKYEERCLVFDLESLPTAEMNVAGTEAIVEANDNPLKYDVKPLVADLDSTLSTDERATENDEAIVEDETPTQRRNERKSPATSCSNDSTTEIDDDKPYPAVDKPTSRLDAPSPAVAPNDLHNRDPAMLSSLDFRPIVETPEEKSAIVEPSWDPAKVLFSEFDKRVDDTSSADPFDTESWGAGLVADLEAEEQTRGSSSMIKRHIVLAANEDELDPLGWPLARAGLLSSQPRKDPFGEERVSDSDGDDGADLLGSASRIKDNDGDGGFHSDTMPLSKNQRIQSYGSKLADDTSSDDEEEGQDSEDDFDAEDDVVVRYVSQDSEDEELEQFTAFSEAVPELLLAEREFIATFESSAVLAGKTNLIDNVLKNIDVEVAGNLPNDPIKFTPLFSAKDFLVSPPILPDSAIALHVNKCGSKNENEDISLNRHSELIKSSSSVSADHSLLAQVGPQDSSAGLLPTRKFSGLPPKGNFPIPPPPPPPPPGSKKKRRKGRRTTEYIRQPIPLLAPPPDDKVKNWEESKATQIHHMGMPRASRSSSGSLTVETSNLASSQMAAEHQPFCRKELVIDDDLTSEGCLIPKPLSDINLLNELSSCHPLGSNIAEKDDQAVVAAANKFHVQVSLSQSYQGKQNHAADASDDLARGVCSPLTSFQLLDNRSRIKVKRHALDHIDKLLISDQLMDVNLNCVRMDGEESISTGQESTNGGNRSNSKLETLSRHLIVPHVGPSAFTAMLVAEPVILAKVLDFLGDPVAVCRMKMVNKACFSIIDKNEHTLMRDAVRLGGMNMNVRPYFWLWVSLNKGENAPEKRQIAESSEPGGSFLPIDHDLASLERQGKEGKWHHVIERDVSRAFGTLPPHKMGARLRTDSIVRALVTWGRSRVMRRGVKGVGEGPIRSDDSAETDDESLSPTDTVSDWGGVTPVGSFSGSFASSNSGHALVEDSKTKSNRGISKKQRTDEELALSFNTLTNESKAALQKKLSFILHALAAAHPEVGYCQGMDYIVAHLLRILQDTIRWKAAHGTLPSVIKSAPICFIERPEERQNLSGIYVEIDQSLVLEETCFRVMDSFFTTYNLQHFYWPELRCLKTCCRVFEKIIQIKLPVLADHFEHHELNIGLFALGWFQTLFLYLPSMPSATVRIARFTI